MNYVLNHSPITNPTVLEKYTTKWLHLNGCFETILIKNAKAQFLPQHLARAKVTNTEIFKTHYVYDDIELAVEVAVSQVCSINQSYKLKLIFENQNIFYSIEPYSTKSVNACKLISKNATSDFKFTLTNHKLCDYAKQLNLLSTIDTKYWDCIRTNDSEYLEGTKANIYFCREGKILTPPAGDLLPGILRAQLLEKGLVKESNIFLKSLGEFDGMLISNSLIEIMAVDELDGYRFAKSQIYAQQLRKQIFS